MTFDRLKSFDASVVLGDVIAAFGLPSVPGVLPAYLRAARTGGRLQDLVPSQLMDALSAGMGQTELPEENVLSSSEQDSKEAQGPQ